MLEVCASKIGDIILSVLESKMENTYSLYMLWSKDLNLGVTVISLNRLSEKNIKCETLLIAIA